MIDGREVPAFSKQSRPATSHCCLAAFLKPVQVSLQMQSILALFTFLFVQNPSLCSDHTLGLPVSYDLRMLRETSFARNGIPSRTAQATGPGTPGGVKDERPPTDVLPSDNDSPSASTTPMIPAFERGQVLTGTTIRVRFAEACAAWLSKSPSRETRSAYTSAILFGTPLACGRRWCLPRRGIAGSEGEGSLVGVGKKRLARKQRHNRGAARNRSGSGRFVEVRQVALQFLQGGPAAEVKLQHLPVRLVGLRPVHSTISKLAIKAT